MRVLGLSGGYGHDPAAAVVAESRIIAAAEEERFTRRKHAFGQVPIHAAAFCLASAGIELQDVDCLAISWQPEHPPPWPTKLHEDLLAHPFFEGAGRPPVEVVSHPLAHAAVAFRSSAFEDAAILIIDGQGDGIATTLARGDGSGVEILEQYEIEDSLGFFYWAVTTHLGWEWGEEGKTMGLAPYGSAAGVPEAFDLWPDGYEARIRSERTDGHFRRGRATFSAWRQFISEHYGPPSRAQYPVDVLTQRRRRTLEITDRERELAAWGQHEFERVALHLAHVAVRRAGSRNLVLGGGSAYNCTLNGLLRAERGIDEVYVFPASGDAGTAIGAAFAVADIEWQRPEPEPLDDAGFGPAFDDDDIARLLLDSGIDARRSDDVSAEAAAFIDSDKIIAWFQGRMELGPRALGNRSILASPRTAAMRDRVNAIKGREPWRPLAPSLLAEFASEYLVDSRPAPFMLTATDVRPDRREAVPAVVHVDGSCRPQTLERRPGNRYVALLTELGGLTGIPVVLNTSFNIGDEPIVLSPRDAIRSFFASGLDALMIGDSIVEKRDRRGRPVSP